MTYVKLTMVQSWLLFLAPLASALMGPQSFDAHTRASARFFDQQQDHFDNKNTNTWQQAYYCNDTFYKPGGPVFIYVGGEVRVCGEHLRGDASIF